MIQKLRVDFRLLHGQVAVSWISGLGSNCILIASDRVSKDEFLKNTLKLAKPSNCKLVIKNIYDSINAINEGKTDKYKLFIVVESIDDAYKLVSSCPKIRSVNLGLTKQTKETKNISKSINVTKTEEKLIDEMIKLGIEVEIRQVPNDKKILVKNIIKRKGELS